ncbi:TRAP transporter small permease [Thermoanaerobacterium sp. DL9XJH110]|uniref:TRAP transporter small permease n=1 Tax=Thermoanaerobacterium sp. DL9XJH110 TaxID=3386643 RepID=UPI003BB51BD5
MRKNKLIYLLNIDLLISGLSLITLIIITFLGVLMRYFFNRPFVWEEEVQLWCFVWLVFFGTSAAFRSGSHVAIEFVVDRLPPYLKKIIEVLGYFVVMFVLIYLMIHGAKLAEQLFYTKRTTNVLDIPYSIIYAALPIGCVLMMINYTLIVVMTILSKKYDFEGGV